MPQVQLIDTPSAVDLSAHDNLVPLFKQHVAEAGLVGEENNAVIVFLTGISCKLQRPLNLTIFGESSAGKNHLMERVGEFWPEEMKKPLTGMSPKALMHSGKEEFKHKVVLIAEYEGVSGADYAIRTMQSEGCIQWDFVNTKKGLKKESNTVEGPAAFIQATTRSVLHPENETRLLSVEIDASPEQTKAIIMRQAERAATGSWRRPADLLELWQQHIRSLQMQVVIIPFAAKIAELFPTELVRTRRDFPKLLGMIEASALTHQAQRERKDDAIIASVTDYAIARDLYLHCYEVGPDRKLHELLKVAEELAQSGTFKVADLVDASGWGKTKIYELVARAEDKGALAEGDTRGEYRFIRSSVVPILQLPETI